MRVRAVRHSGRERDARHRAASQVLGVQNHALRPPRRRGVAQASRGLWQSNAVYSVFVALRARKLVASNRARSFVVHVHHEPPVFLVHSALPRHELLLHAVPPYPVLVHVRLSGVQVELHHGVEFQLRVIREGRLVDPPGVRELVLHPRKRVVDSGHLHDILEQPRLRNHLVRRRVDFPPVHPRRGLAFFKRVLDPFAGSVRLQRAVEKPILPDAHDHHVPGHGILPRVDEVVHHLVAPAVYPGHFTGGVPRNWAAGRKPEPGVLGLVVPQRVLAA
mmetsp:Transcript_11072/g.36538  ORF Transcript_11072/g.36538 Transcript_11072/m.36538 type:complete len:276 (+) Transcript_11072:1189-2016(+)